MKLCVINRRQNKAKGWINSDCSKGSTYHTVHIKGKHTLTDTDRHSGTYVSPQSQHTRDTKSCTITFVHNGLNKLSHVYSKRGDGLAQWLEIQRSKVQIPSGAHENNVEFFRVKKVVLTRCRCAQPPVCIAYARIRKTMHAR